MKTLIFLLLTSISIFAQKEKQFLKFSQNVLDEQLIISLHHNFSGNVKSIIEKTFSLDTSINNIGVVESVVVFDSLGNLLQTHDKSNFFSCKEHCFYSYDSRGRIIKHKFYTSKNELYEKGFYKYNRTGLLVKICVKKRFGISKTILINKYDTQDRLIESVDKECGLADVFRTEFKYNSNNQLEEEVYYYDSVKSYSYFFKYNKEDKISEKKYTEFEKFDSIDNNSISSYKYNENGDLIEIKCLNFLNKSIYSHEYLFDSNFILIESFYEDYDDGVKKIKNKKYFHDEKENISTVVSRSDKDNVIYTTYYLFDSHGNWIEKYFYKDLIKYVLVERKFEYFE